MLEESQYLTMFSLETGHEHYLMSLELTKVNVMTLKTVTKIQLVVRVIGATFVPS